MSCTRLPCYITPNCDPSLSFGCSNSTARVMQSWDPSMPLYGRLCGMLAFGCVRGSAC